MDTIQFQKGLFWVLNFNERPRQSPAVCKEQLPLASFISVSIHTVPQPHASLSLFMPEVLPNFHSWALFKNDCLKACRKSIVSDWGTIDARVHHPPAPSSSHPPQSFSNNFDNTAKVLKSFSSDGALSARVSGLVTFCFCANQQSTPETKLGHLVPLVVLFFTGWYCFVEIYHIYKQATACKRRSMDTVCMSSRRLFHSGDAALPCWTVFFFVVVRPPAA